MANKFIKKLKYTFQLFDGIWTVPLTFLGFWLLGFILESVFGFATGTYDMGFIQPLLLSISIVIGATNAAILGMRFTFRGLFKYLYGYKNEEGKIVNPSKNDFYILDVKYRFTLTFLVFFFYVFAVIFVYLKFV